MQLSNNIPGNGGALPPPQISLDFWDSAGNGTNQDTFEEVIQIEQEGSNVLRILAGILMGLFILAGTYLGYEYYVNDNNILYDLAQIYLPWGESEEVAVAPQPPVKAEPQPIAEPPSKVVAGNPYWALPNRFYGISEPLGRAWTVEEEELWSAGITHPFTYQRYKTVMEVRRERLAGSEVIFWSALEDVKLWTRMWAVIGLTEFRIPVSLKTVEKALGRERSELVSGFFERFITKSTPAQRYVMRQALRLLDERGRLVVLQALDRAADEHRDLYILAATFDPGKQVQAWVKETLFYRPIAAEKIGPLKDIINGKSSAEDWLVVKEEAAVAELQNTAPRKQHAATDQELNEFETASGNVSFYPVTEEDEGNPLEE